MNMLNLEPEELHEELKAKLITTEKGMKVIHHPLMIEIMPAEELYAFYNKRFKMLSERTALALAQKDFSGYVFLHEKPYRLDAFRNYLILSGAAKYEKEYWEILSEIWVTIENVWQQQKVWYSLLSKKFPNKQYFMEADERKAFQKLPEKFKIYRGCNDKNRNGFSWTLDWAKAEWFSKRWWQNGYVIEKEVRKEDVFAYITRRGESEIIYLKSYSK